MPSDMVLKPFHCTLHKIVNFHFPMVKMRIQEILSLETQSVDLFYFSMLMLTFVQSFVS